MRCAGAILLGLFVFVAIFGLPVMLSHDGHHVGCPLQAVGEVMCEKTVLDHFSMWQVMFASVVGTLVLLVGFALLMFVHVGDALFVRERLRLRLAFATPARSTLMQELYSRGILNRKEPSFS